MDIVKFTPEKLPLAIVGQPYSQQVSVTNIGFPWTFSMSPQSFNGLAISSDGIISGMPTEEGHADLQVTATSSNGLVVVKNY